MSEFRPSSGRAASRLVGRSRPRAATESSDDRSRSLGYRWFTNPEVRTRYAPEDHQFLSRMFTAGLRGVLVHRGPGSRAAQLAELLLERSDEFRRLWADHEVGLRPREVKHFIHPEVGAVGRPHPGTAGPRLRTKGDRNRS